MASAEDAPATTRRENDVDEVGVTSYHRADESPEEVAGCAALVEVISRNKAPIKPRDGRNNVRP